MLEYQLIRSKRRKTLGLQVKHGQVTVRAPHYVTTAFIDTFIQEKSAWLRSKIAEHSKRPICFDFSQDSTLYFLGEALTLNICTAKQASVFINNSSPSESDFGNTESDVCQDAFAFHTLPRQLKVVISERVNRKLLNPILRTKQVKKQLEGYLKREAEQLIIERLEVLSEQTSLKPTQVNIRQYRARWGSCNNRGEVSFNYLLMMTPVFVIDYVIIQELCHLTYLNHSKDFWLLVEKYCPEFKIAKQWLHAHQAELSWQTPN